MNSLNPHDVSDSWNTRLEFKQREYKNYDQYKQHQASKLQQIDLDDYEVRLRRELGRRFGELIHMGMIRKEGVALCLAARLGAEVRAFIDNGYFAIGIDLNPGNRNSFVVVGDFHNLQFANACIDVIYTNALDHAFDLKKIGTEVLRVLKPGGSFIIDAVPGSSEGREPEEFASYWWNSMRDLERRFTEIGFEEGSVRDISMPFKNGSEICLKSPKSRDPAEI